MIDLSETPVLYAVRYNKIFPTRREEAAFQHSLGRRLLYWTARRERGFAREELKTSIDPYGRPFFVGEPVQFSLAHCRGLVCCALDDCRLGVDCEPIRPFNPRLAARVCTDEELSALDTISDKDVGLTVLWTLKESALKYHGRGMAYGFRNTAFLLQKERFVSREGVLSATWLDVPGFVVSLVGPGAATARLALVSVEELERGELPA